MDHNLAEELKDAGYRQNPEGAGQFDYIDKDNHRGNLDAEESYYVPTLSELIEACGDEFQSLSRAENYIGGHGFLAFTTKNNPKFITIGGEKEAWCEFGKIPDIAVARLWLVLNKNKDAE